MNSLWYVKDLAEYLGLTKEYIRIMARCGKIPAECIVRPMGCRKYRFHPEKIKIWAKGTPTQHQARSNFAGGSP